LSGSGEGTIRSQAQVFPELRERARAVKNRPLPPVAGPDKKRFIERAQVDFMDFAMLGDATGTLEDGVLTFGQPSIITTPALTAEYVVRPRIGMLVLFPSYIWHGTVPFHSAAVRTTIAFDAVPTG